MSPRKRKRVAALQRLSRYCNVRQLMKEEHLSARELADLVLGFEAHARAVFCGGAARFMGNNRVFGNGAGGLRSALQEVPAAFLGQRAA